MKKTLYVSYSNGGEPFLTMFLAPTKDKGLSIGFTDPAFRNIHLTVYTNAKTGMIHSHITDEGKSARAWSQQIDPAFVGTLTHSWTKHWLIDGSKVKDCWVMKHSLSQKIASVTPRTINKNLIDFPIEGLYTKVLLDLTNRERWKRIRPKELGVNNPIQGVTIINGKTKWILRSGFKDNAFLCFSDRQYTKFQERILRLYGMDMLLLYLEQNADWDQLRKSIAVQRFLRGD